MGIMGLHRLVTLTSFFLIGLLVIKCTTDEILEHNEVEAAETEAEVNEAAEDENVEENLEDVEIENDEGDANNENSVGECDDSECSDDGLFRKIAKKLSFFNTKK